MAVKLRLRREGAKKKPHYRVVAADSRSPRDGRFIEIIGEYHPGDEPSRVEIDEERALYWLRNGAQPTNQVQNLLRITGVWEQFKPGDAPKRVREDKKVRTSAKARDKAAQAAEQSQETGGGDAPVDQSPAAPEEVEAAPGTPEDATAEPVAETQATSAPEGAPGEGVSDETAPEQTPTDESDEEEQA